jgi:NTE family protein
MRRPDVLVLGGGGPLGEAWLRSLLAGVEAEAGWDLREADAFVGTSAGSIVAATLAAGRRPRAATAAAAAWEEAAAAGSDRPAVAAGADRAAAPGRPDGARRRAAAVAGARRGATKASDILVAPVAPMVAAALKPAGALVRGAVLRRGAAPTREIPQLARHLDALRAGWDGRLRVTAVDRASGKRVVFGAPDAPEATVTQAVLASCAVPWVFAPQQIGGREYVDGGAWSAANLDAAPVQQGTRVLCLLPTGSARLGRDPLGAYRVASRAGTAGEALLLRRRGATVRVVAPDAATVTAMGGNLFDLRRRAAVEATGYAQGRALASPA